MDKYDKTKKCPKCGNIDIVDSFHRKGEMFYDREKQFTNSYSQDCIQRFCSNCKYSWFEIPLDKKENKEKQNGNRNYYRAEFTYPYACGTDCNYRSCCGIYNCSLVEKIRRE